jgi:hypothetical protein
VVGATVVAGTTAVAGATVVAGAITVVLAAGLLSTVVTGLGEVDRRTVVGEVLQELQVIGPTAVCVVDDASTPANRGHRALRTTAEPTKESHSCSLIEKTESCMFNYIIS